MKIDKLDTEFQDVEAPKQTITTSCKLCVFAEKEGKTQTGCSLGRLEKMAERGVNRIEAEDLEENEFYVLETSCFSYREEVWKTANEGKDLKEVLEQENYPKVGFVIIIRDSIEGLETTISSALSQEKFNPTQILLVNTGEEDYFDMIEKAQDLLEDTGVDYKVQDVPLELTDDEIVDEAFSNAKNGFYSVFESGKEIPKDTIKILHEAINEKLIKVAFVKGYDGVNGLTVQCMLHKFLYGNKGASLEKKLLEGEEIDKVEDGNSLVKTWDELR